MAKHHEDYSHDSINRFLRFDVMTPRLLWRNVKDDIVQSEDGYVLFDDVVLDKRHSRVSRLVRRQWSGNEKRVIYGIGVVTCVYVNPEMNRFWLLDYRIYDVEGDGNTKLDHLQEMLGLIEESKGISYRTVLMDSWYASVRVMKYIESLAKIYYCPLKSNRHVSEDQDQAYQRVDQLSWSDQDQEEGKTVHLKKMPKGHQVKLFRIVLSTQRTEHVVTNDMTQDDTDVAKVICGIRWKIEEFHREAKQVTGLEGFQCRVPRAIRNHIASAFLVWHHLKKLALQTSETIYQLKFTLLEDYMKQQLNNPSIPMVMIM